MSCQFSHPTSSIRIHLLISATFVFWLPTIATTTGFTQVITNISPTTGVADLGTTVASHGHTVQITGGARPGNGVNLFHSFDEFNVGRGDTAQFLNTTPSLHTSNILNRVTGENPSSIFGTIDTMSYPGANLFLMNPAGIVFGPSARLHVGGSVAFTTADYLRLAGPNGSNGGTFYANSTATSVLTSASVAAFGFLDFSSAPIALRGSKFAAPPGQSIAFIGGDITVQSGTVENGTVRTAHLSAPGGQIIMVGVASPGEILSETLDPASNISGQSFGRLGTIQISEQSRINTSGVGGGAVRIRGGNLIVDDSIISANSTKAAKSGKAPRLDPSWLGIGIEMVQDVVIDNGTIIETNVKAGATRDSGGVRITADHITISGGPKIVKSIETNPDDDIPFAGISSNIFALSSAARSGDISLAANSITIKDFGQIRTHTDGTGNAGSIILSASKSIETDRASIVSTAEDESSGDSGSITIGSSHGDVRLTRTTITSQTGDNSGDAAGITIYALLRNVLLDGTQVFNFIGEGSGKLGGIQIKANDLDLHNRAIIAGNNFSTPIAGNIAITLDGRLNLSERSRIQTDALGTADAANLIVKASDILISDGAKLTSEASSSGTGGAITLVATNQVSLTNGASITARSTGPADAGTISINAGRQLDVIGTSTTKSSITTEAKQAQGGDIKIQAIDRVRVVDGEISTSVLGGAGSGGNISIDPKVVILQNSDVLAQAVRGNGGDISITTPVFVADQSSLVDASTPFGLNGRVTIQSPTSNLSGTVGQLVSKTTPPQVLLQNRCVALAGGEQSTFLLSGRDAVPAEPGGWISSPISMEHWTGEETEHASGLMVRKTGSPRSSSIAAHKHDPQILSLRRLTPPGFLVRTFATGSTGCPS